MTHAVPQSGSPFLDNFDTSTHTAFDAITEHVRQLFHVKCVLLLLETPQGIRSLSWQGWEPSSLLSHAICHNILSTHEQFDVEDMHCESEFYQLPWAQASPYFRFFAVQPLCVSNENMQAALVLLDQATHRLGPRTRQRLAQVGKVVETMIDYHQMSLLESDLSSRMLNDAITKAQNRFLKREDDRQTFEGLLSDLLLITRSEFGLIGELKYYPGGKPYLQMHAISNIAWDKQTNALYERTAREGLVFDNLDNLLGRSVKTRRTTIANDVQNDARSQGTPLGHPEIRSFMGMPLFSGDNLVGLIGLANRPHGYSEAMEQFFLPLSNTVGTLIERKRLLSEKRRHRNELYQVANYDSLTQLPNRRKLLIHLENLILGCHETPLHFSVCFIDLDGFKKINDGLGHEAGDHLLKALSINLHAVIRGEDFLARIGGDEFVLILNGDQTEQSFQRILDAVNKEVIWRGQSLRVSASMGVTSYPGDIETADGLLRHADQAMYRAKQQGKNQYIRYSPELEKSQQERYALIEAFQHALNRQELILYLQPKVELKTGHTYAYEVLIRWQHPQDGLLFPDQFLPALADTELMAQLDRYVLERAIRIIEQHDLATVGIGMAVNVTPAFLLSEAFNQALKMLRLAPPTIRRLLTLEIVESTLLSDMDLAVKRLQDCKQMGVSISLDDFGTSFSSLTYFRSLPIDEIKIDKSFVMGMLDNEEDAKLVASIIGIAKSFDRMVIAEGIETEGHVAALRALGCDKGQGYHYSAPQPASEVLAPK